MSYKLFTIGKKAVKVIARFDHSWLIEYVIGGRQVSIDPKFVKSKTINYKKLTINKPVNLQTQLKL
jgi:hypothetical protein